MDLDVRLGKNYDELGVPANILSYSSPGSGHKGDMLSLTEELFQQSQPLVLLN